MPKIILVTGASSGFGLSLVEQILARGDVAVATLRNPSALTIQHDNIFVLPLDITNSEQRVATFNAIKEKYGKLDVVINNAGVVGPIGELEGHEEKAARQVFETNFWGTLEMCKLSAAFFRDNNGGKGGRIINISSFVGYSAFPGCSIYNASKHALESATESFSQELDPEWNIKVTLIEPGQFATGAVKGGNSAVDPVHPAYTKPTLAVNGMREMLKSFHAAGDPKKAVTVMLKVVDMSDEEVPLRQAVGSDSTELILGGLEKVRKDMERGRELASEASN